MTEIEELEATVRAALRSLPEPEMRIPADFSEKLRDKRQRQLWFAPVAAAVLAAAVGFAPLLWNAGENTSSPTPPAVSPAVSPAVTPRAGKPSPAPSPAVLPHQQLTAATLPGWSQKSADDLNLWSAPPKAFTVAGSPPFVVGNLIPGAVLAKDPTNAKRPTLVVEFQRTDAQVDMSTVRGFSGTLPPRMRAPRIAQRQPTYGCETGHGGIEDNTAAASAPVVQVRCWPTLQENIWVWANLPANVTTVAYVLDGHIVARASTLDGVGAIRIPRPVDASSDQGQLEILTATGDVLSRAKLPWIA